MAIDPRELRRVMTDIRSTVQEQPRDALVEILSYLFKEYVIEGPGPIGAGAGQVLDARSHLEGLPFAELITWLQQHVAAPELQLFEVDGAQVSVRIRGQQIVLEAPRTPIVDAPIAAPARGIPSAEIASSIRNVAAQAPAVPIAPPSIAPSSVTPTSAPAAPNAATAPASGDGQDRFSWLEVD